MFSPKYFQIQDLDEVMQFMEEHSFATVVTVENGQPIATHIPVHVQKEGEDVYLTGHLAYGNPQWRTFATTERTLVIFQGPHAYISSSWYNHENVPTWNYQSVHVYGQAQILQKEELMHSLAQQLEKYEKHREQPVLWETLSPKLIEQQLKGIVGFKVKVEQVQATYKLSQNRNAEDYEQIIEQLQQEGNDDALHVADAMKQIKRKEL